MVAAAEMSRVCVKAAMIYPVAFVVHAYALLTLPLAVAVALFRSVTGVKSGGVDDLFASVTGSASEAEKDTALLRNLREKHNLATAALRDQLEDCDSRYKAVYEKLRESERMRNKMQRRLTAAQEELILSGGRVPESPGGPGAPGGDRSERLESWGDRDGGEKDDPDRIPTFVTMFLCIGALMYFYDVPDVPAFDRKLAMIAPGAWMMRMSAKQPTLNKLVICGNLVFFGYLAHILVQHRRGTYGIGSSPTALVA